MLDSRRRRSSSTPAAALSPCTSRSITRRPLAMPTRSFRAAASVSWTARPGATWRASAAFHTCRPPPPTPRWAPRHDRRSPDRGRPRLPRHPLPSPGPPARRRAGLRRPAGGGAARRRPGAAGPYRLRPPAPWRRAGGHARRPAAAAARAAPRSAPRRHPAYEHGARAAAPRPAGRRHHHSCLRCRRTGGGASSRQPLAPAHRARVLARGAVPMSTTGQSVGGIIGAITGAILGGPTGAIYGAQIGMTIGGLLDPPKGPSQHGPSPDQLRLTTSTYGANIPRVYGTCPVAGNVVWLEGDKYRVKKKKSGGKGGGSVTTYKIFATFAVVLCEGPIAGIRRLWLGSELVYDGAAATASGVIKSGKSKSSWKLYTGTDTQQPDPRYQADKGANAASGWPGLAYIVFYDLPLEKWQNTLAGVQIKAEVVTSGSSAFSRIASVSDTGKHFKDNSGTGLGVPYIRRMVDNVLYVNIQGSTTDYLFTSDGIFKGTQAADKPATLNDVTVGANTYRCCGFFGNSYLWAYQSFSLIPAGSLVMGASPSIPDRIIGAALPSGVSMFAVIVSSDNQAVIVLTDENLGSGQRWYEIDTSGVVLASGVYSGGTGTLSGVNTVFGISRGGGWHFGSSCYDRGARIVVCAYGAGSGDVDLFAIGNDGTWAKLTDQGLPAFNFSHPTCFIVGRVGMAFSGSSYGLYGETLTLNAVGLGAIVQAECLQSNLLTAGDLDVTGLSADSVRGFRVSDTGPIRASLEPLSMIWPFDCRMHGYKLQFVRRGSASVASVPAADLDARMEGSDPGPLLTLPRDMDTQLPQKVVLGFLDVDREYDRGEQESARYNTDARNIAEPEVAVVLNAQEGKGASEVLRLTNVNTTPAGIQECTARRDKPAGYTSSAVAETGTHTGAGLIVYGPTVDVLMDIPALTAEGNIPGFYAAACGVMPTWPGALLYASYSNGQDWEDVATWDNDSFIGVVATALGAATCFDRVDAAGTLTVSPYAGTLASVTEDQMLAGSNHFAYGAHGRWEILAARSVTLNGYGTYTLQDFLRGRLGTEQYASTHQANDLLVQLKSEEH